MVTGVTERVYFQKTRDGVLLQQEAGARRTGLWKLPALEEGGRLPPVLYRGAYTITRYRVLLHVHQAGKSRAGKHAQHQAIIPFSELPHLPMPSPYRRALEAVLGNGTR